MDQAGKVTMLLAEVRKGNPEAEGKLIPLVYDELRRLAGSYMRRERENHTLQATALVHEAYLKLVRQDVPDWQSRAHFFGIAAQLMRQVLVDHARSHARHKRGGGQEMVVFDEAVTLTPSRSFEVLEIDEALQRLTKMDPRQGKIVELRFFGGLTVEETSDVLGVSPKTVKREWSLAKMWLQEDLARRHSGRTTGMVDPGLPRSTSRRGERGD